MGLLELKGLTKYFVGLAALKDVDLEVREGEIMGLIGPNGAGKTTLFNVISGLFPATRGRIIFRGNDITGLSMSRIAGMGLARTFQTTDLFQNFSVIDNVLIGCHLQVKLRFFGALLGTPGTRKRQSEVHQKAMDIIRFMGLDVQTNELSKNLPHGQQRALGIAIALATEPTLLMLDEPATGMNVEETETIMNLLLRLKERGITILLVEHNMRAVMGYCDRIAVLNTGMKIAEGTPEEVCMNKDVIQAYLGTGEDVT